MTTDPFKESMVAVIKTLDVVAWTSGKEASRLFLPPIQRSIVWSNAQIVNYWDSLLRGYPAGLMMVHRSRRSKEGEASKGRTADGTTCEASAEDFHLFDGQQRMAAILLGHRAGPLNGRINLWVDLKAKPSSDSGLFFQLRVNSTGQPFGYEAQSPNQKPALGKRRKRIEQWRETHGMAQFVSPQAFAAVEGKDLIEADHATVPLFQVISVLLEKDAQHAIDDLTQQYPDVLPSIIETFVHALDGALKLPIIFQLIDPKVVEDENEYIRYFGRLGQGGTPLSDDELTYSIIKHQYPEVHDRMKEIMDGPAGRLASEVNLVLAALRVAKVRAPWDGALEWQIVVRPYPAFVSRFREFPGVAAEFKKMIPLIPGGRLKELLEVIRERLVYHKTQNPGGLPVMLLARMPHQLVDVLLLMEIQDGQNTSSVVGPGTLIPFVLHWLLFVSDYDKAATLVFKQYRESSRIAGQNSIQGLLRDFEKAEIAPILPFRAQLPQLREEIENGSHLLRNWAERFARLDSEGGPQYGHALRVLSTNHELVKRALIWVQRDYLAESFGHFDPTSSRDEDLPIDLDHLIPHSKFGIDWRSQRSNLEFDDTDENFRHRRSLVGNSLGNFRWLDAAENRGRGAREIEVLKDNGDFLQAPEAWNRLIDKTPWERSDVAGFQKLIDLRTLDIYEALLVQGRLDSIVSDTKSTLVSLEG